VTIQENYPPNLKGTHKNTAAITTKSMLLLSKLSLLITFFLIFQQNDFLSTTEFIASCEFSLANIISVHAMIEVK